MLVVMSINIIQKIGLKFITGLIKFITERLNNVRAGSGQKINFNAFLYLQPQIKRIQMFWGCYPTNVLGVLSMNYIPLHLRISWN